MGAGQTLRGLVGQGMRGGRALSTDFLAVYDSTSGAGSFTSTTACVALIFAWGAGGGAVNGGDDSGGGGGAAGYKRVKLSSRRTVSWTVGAAAIGDGGDSVVSIPGTTLTACGGKAPSGGVGGLGGTPSGNWDIARRGGNGGTGATAGESPLGGGAGGNWSIGAGNDGGGGGAAGFTDLFGGLVPGKGGNGNSGGANATAPGGGRGGGEMGAGATTGTAGRVFIVLVRNPS